MEVKFVLAVTSLCVGILHVNAFSTGAPKDACVDLVPQHNTEPQKGNFPYTIKTNVAKIRPSQKVKVTISSDDGTKFKGFMIQARIGETPFGTFSPAEGVNLVDCGAGKKNTATHTDSKEKSAISLIWTAPAKLQGSVVFTATVAKNGGVFWVAQKATPVTVQ